ncbi:DUF11 domain-containing protein [Patescibacteria group bacterium]|nr:DUF11 domain-containing protein [Patescibacteria group bacterium]
MSKTARRTQYFVSLMPIAICAVFVAGTVFPLQIGVSNALVIPECNDGIDNDDNGTADFPEDLGCSSYDDNREVGEGPDLFLTLSDGMDDVEVGESLTYTISMRTGLDVPYTTDVRFFLPSYVNLMSSSENGRRNGNIVMWEDVVVYPGFVKTLNVSVELMNTIPDEELLFAEAAASDQRATDTTMVLEKDVMRVPFEIFVDDGKVYAEPGEVNAYKISVKNAFGDDRTFTLHAQIPITLEFLNASGMYKRTNRSIEWEDEYIAAGETVVYEIVCAVERDMPEFTTITLNASAEAAYGSDSTTIIYEKVPPAGLSVTVNDGHIAAKVGDELTYEIVIHNNQSKFISSIDVVNALPIYSEFVVASDGGTWTGKEVYWKGISVSPNGKRVLYVTGRVRSDAPLGAALRNGVRVASGHEAVDVTEVSDVTVSQNAPAKPVKSNVLLRKVADRSEIRPGDTVSYSIYLRNTLDHAISNVVVEDRIDQAYTEILDGDVGQMVGDRIVWNIPVMEPGASWDVSYTVRISPNAPHGIGIANVVSVSGDGLENIALTERVHTSQIGVMTYLPNSGAPLDVMMSGVLMLLAGIPTIWTRRRLLV